jgi:hypothetical protein
MVAATLSEPSAWESVRLGLDVSDAPFAHPTHGVPYSRRLQEGR